MGGVRYIIFVGAYYNGGEYSHLQVCQHQHAVRKRPQPIPLQIAPNQILQESKVKRKLDDVVVAKVELGQVVNVVTGNLGGVGREQGCEVVPR